MKQVIFVFIGGGIGSILRYGFGKIFQTLPSGFPVSTFLVNIIGCLLIGFLMGVGVKFEDFNENQYLLLVTGLCGGFTTFSAFAAENQMFLKSGEYLHFGIYSLASIGIGISAVVLGLYIAKQI
jgi:CrcB protein